MATLVKSKTKPQPHSVVDILNKALASAIDLKLQTKQAHWNIKGKNFVALHELFDKVGLEVESFYDMIAERVVQLDGTALGTLQAVSKSSTLPSYPTDIHDSQKHVKFLGKAIHALAEHTRKAIDAAEEHEDAVTADVLTEVTRGLDKLRWFVESHSE